MWVLIRANEDMVAQAPFTMHSTIRGDQSPFNQHFCILASNNKRRGRISKQHQVPLQPIHQGGTDPSQQGSVANKTAMAFRTYGNRHPRGDRQ